MAGMTDTDSTYRLPLRMRLHLCLLGLADRARERWTDLTEATYR